MLSYNLNTIRFFRMAGLNPDHPLLSLCGCLNWMPGTRAGIDAFSQQGPHSIAAVFEPDPPKIGVACVAQDPQFRFRVVGDLKCGEPSAADGQNQSWPAFFIALETAGPLTRVAPRRFDLALGEVNSDLLEKSAQAGG